MTRRIPITHLPDTRAADLVVRFTARAEEAEAQAAIFARRAQGRLAATLKQAALRLQAEAADYRLAVALLGGEA